MAAARDVHWVQYGRSTWCTLSTIWPQHEMYWTHQRTECWRSLNQLNS